MNNCTDKRCKIVTKSLFPHLRLDFRKERKMFVHIYTCYDTTKDDFLIWKECQIPNLTFSGSNFLKRKVIM